jgi:hypothetical protein
MNREEEPRTQEHNKNSHIEDKQSPSSPNRTGEVKERSNCHMRFLMI